ncbi:MAG: nucleotidyltransferase family protein [Candidatus Methanomethylicaceae archaeon]
MRAIVLAGGYAKRLWPLTLDRPKPLLPLGDGYILDFVISRIMTVNEISEIIISTNKRFELNFVEWVKERGHSNIIVVSEPSMREEEKLGPINAVWAIVKNQPDDYLIVAGDNLFSVDLKEMVSFYHKVKAPVIALFEISDRELAKQYACVELDKNSCVIKFEEKPKEPKSLLVSTGIYVLPWRSLFRVHEYLNEGNPPDPIGKFIEWLTKTERVYGFKFKGYWYDIGSHESYGAAKEAFKDFSFKYRRGQCLR